MLRVLVTLACVGTAVAKGEGGGMDLPCEISDVPRAYNVKFPAAEGQPTYVATNLGILVTEDEGTTFEVICPAAIGRSTQPNGLLFPSLTPGVALLPDGAVLATGSPLGILRVEDACSIAGIEDDYLEVHVVAAMAVTPGGTVFATIGIGADPLGVVRSLDGKTFELVFSSKELLFGGVVPGSDDLAVYAVGTSFFVSPPQYTLLGTSDGGDNWTPRWMLTDGSQMGIGAVSATNPEEILLRRRASTGFCDFQDAVWWSEDGGTTATELLALEADALTGTLIRPDGSFWIAGLETGLQKSADGLSWAPMEGPSAARCMNGTDAEVVVCLPTPDDKYGIVARTVDEGATWEPWLTLEEVVGPRDCLRDICQNQWHAFGVAWLGKAPVTDGGADDDGGVRRDGAMDGDEPEARDGGGCGCALGAR